MKKQIMLHIYCQAIFSMLIVGVLLLPQAGFAASTSTMLRQIGSGANPYSGDYISSNLGAGLDLYYRYFIEVPTGTARLTVEIYDADIGAVANYTDWQIGGGYNTACRYRLIRPAGTNAATMTFNNTQTAADSVWTQLYTVADPPAGHWELQVDMTSARTAGDDVNGYGIRAHDGTSGSGGTELNIYADSFIPLGVIQVNPTTMTTTMYPYVTSGCTVDWNDFDGDDNGAGAFCRLSYASRVGTVPTTTYYGSANDAWGNRPITGYSTDFLNIDSGIWTATAAYTNLTGSTANFGVFWAGNWLAATGAPSAQPEANSFRVYLPTDGGGAPAKPFVTQKVSYIFGPNPPLYTTPTASTTVLRIEIVVFNPAVQAITFSAANLVTANIPGGGVVYGGNAIASQGQASIIAPALGGTGNITWNPGSLAGGGTYATLYYYVEVTPTSAARIPVTGSPAANGTTARFVDTTGNTTQARATYTYGPLCELAVTPGGDIIPTWVAISCFEANMSSGQPIVEWHTAAENGTIGFYLWRQNKDSKEFQLVNPNFLPAPANAMTGGVYRLVDPKVQYGETVVYRIEEINARGHSQNYGPFTVTFDDASANIRETGNFYKKSSKEIQTKVSGFQSAVFTASEYEKNRLQARHNVLRTQASMSANQGSGRARIVVKSRGLFHLDAAGIAAALGMSVAQVEGLIASQQLSLSNLGEPVAWLADANRSGIYFYNEHLRSPYSDQNIYWLEQGGGLALATVDGGNAAPVDAGRTFNVTSHYEENRYPLTSLFTRPDDDFWLWDVVIAGDEGKSFPIQIPGPAAVGTAILTVNMQGATDTPSAIDHDVLVLLNGRMIGGTRWDGLDANSCQLNFPQSVLIDGENTVNICSLNWEGVPYSYLYVNSFDLSYQRYYKAVNNILWCQGDTNQTISVTGFSETQVMVWDISQPRQPKLVVTTAGDQSGRITFNPAAPTNKYLLIGLSAVLQPFSVTAASSTNLKRNADPGEYLIIAPQEFANVAQQLADYRRGQGLSASVVTIEDIYDNFNFGLASPLAIKDFLYYVYSQGNVTRLKYAVLVGKGTFDYKNYLGHDDNLFPVILANTSEGLFAADNLYGDVEGNDGIPEIAIGRLPVVSAEELQTVINKIKAYGNSQGYWTDKALMISDNADSGGDFLSTSEALIKQLDGYAIERLSLPGFDSGKTRLRIIAGINAGAALVNYVGHAGLDQLAQENIFSIYDLPLLQNGNALPIMILVTCAAGRFDIPGNVCLSEALLLKDNGGVATMLAPTSASYNSQAGLLVEEFYKAAFSAKEKDLGTAWLRAAKNFIFQAGNPDLLNIYNILGDPAVMFK
jgi:hypothetical protein